MSTFNIKKGLLDLGNAAFSAGNVDFVFAEFTVSACTLDWKKKGQSFEAEKDGCFFGFSSKGKAFSFTFENRSGKDIFLKSIKTSFASGLQKEKLAADQWFEFINSFSFEKLSGIKKVGIETRMLEANPSSSFAYALSSRNSERAFLFAIQHPHRGDYTEFSALHDSPHMEGCFGVKIESVQERLVKNGVKLETTSVKFDSGIDAVELLNKLGQDWKASRAKLPLKDVRLGWNSWDYYTGSVTSKNIFDNQMTAKKAFDGNVKYFVIDEGYEPRWGAWRANWKFPEGLDGYCEKIKKEGGVPGVWTAALMMNKYTDTYRQHPDWFARDLQGNIASKLYSYGPMAFLDVTHSDAAEFVSNIFKNLKKCGFEYFKVDFTQEALTGWRFHDPTVPRGEILRRTFSIIRDAIGKDSYLLACGAPYESVTGIVDACRSTGDIHNFWAHVLRNASSMCTKWWMHRTLWNNDPDFLVVRCPETAPGTQMNAEYTSRKFSWKDTWYAGREMNLREVKAYSLLVYLSAGDLFLSDNLAELNKTGLDIIRKVIARPLANAAVPTDIFDRHDSIPSIWVAKEKKFSVIGLFNWEEDDAEFTIEPVSFGIKGFKKVSDFWDSSKIKVEKGLITVRLEARSAAGLVFE